MKAVEKLDNALAIPVHTLTSQGIPDAPGVYAWYRAGRLFYVGEARNQPLRGRIWGNHLTGNAYGSTLRNKVAQAKGCRRTGKRRYPAECEAAISALLKGCTLRFFVTRQDETTSVQNQLIEALDPPMNDHPGQKPRWRKSEVREILGLEH